MANRRKEQKDLRDFSRRAFVRFSEEDRRRADSVLELLQKEVEKEAKETDKKKPDRSLRTTKMDKRRKLKNGEKEKVVYVCDYCQKVFPIQSRLKLHVLVHTGRKDYHCNLCDYSCAQKGHLTVHIRRHLNERPFKCQEINCGVSCTTSGNLKTHQLNHNKLKKFLCSLCPYKTHSKDYLTAHVKSIHSKLKPFKCPHENCEYSAKRKDNLNQHIQIHSLEKNQICPHPNCGFKSKWSPHLKLHLKIAHSNTEKRLKCHFCKYSSNRKDSLVVHVRQHTGETPFACQLCSFEFKTKSHLNRHLKAVHPHEN